MNLKKIINSYINQFVTNQHVIAFHPGAIRGMARGGNDITRYRQSNPDSSPTRKAFRVLIAVPSYAADSPCMKDVSHAYHAFTKSGYKVDFVTADGSPIQFSKSDLTDPVNRWFVEDKNAQYNADQPLEVKDVMPGLYVGVYFTGSNGLVTENQWFMRLAEQVLNNNGVVAGFGDAEEAIQNLGLTNYVESGYSLPQSAPGGYHSQYDSVVTDAVKLKTGWMIHNNKLVSSDLEDIDELSERIVDQLEK